ncbi:hypothetical protein [Streptomyces sp. ISL-94]|uniref:hypothetical protein n=1 Tax=Streptomyces sp. ISL-94 TaxID=2819190 RepID=UPI001BECF7E9|nr:hypothetical protein [Streptomyces sp. ISL-94]MBT2479605.1 hypothetical protein [Streptomyces sp. ISL-94]
MSGDTGSDLEMDPVAVKNITDGLRAAVGELREFGQAGPSSMGAGFSKLVLTGMEAGHDNVASVFADLCMRWEWGVRGLVMEASKLAGDLKIAAGLVWEEDQYRGGTFKVAANAFVGNPHADEDTVEQQSWDSIVRNPVVRETPEQAQQATEDFDAAWADAKHKVLNEGFVGDLVERSTEFAGMTPEELERIRNPDGAER